MIEWITRNIVPALCRFMAVFPFPSQLAPREWRDLADVLEGKPVPEDRRVTLRRKLGQKEKATA